MISAWLMSVGRGKYRVLERQAASKDFTDLTYSICGD